MLRRGCAFAVTVRAFVFGIDALDKAGRTFYRFPNAVNFYYVGSD